MRDYVSSDPNNFPNSHHYNKHPDCMTCVFLHTHCLKQLRVWHMYTSVMNCSVLVQVRENIQSGNISQAYRNAYSVRIVSRLAYLFGTLVFVGVLLAIILPLTLHEDNNDDYDDY